jgi:phage tail sheath protein FI
LADLAGRLQAAIRSAPATPGAPPTRPEFTGATVRLVGPNLDQVQIVPGVGSQPAVRFSFSGGGATAAGLTTAAKVNVACYALGTNPGGTSGRAQVSTGNTPGDNGDLPAGTDILGQEAVAPATGMYSLNTVDIFNLLCLPRVAKVSTAVVVADNFAVAQVIPTVSAATDYVRRRRAMLLLDPPDDVQTPAEMRRWMNDNAGLRDPNVALHFPRMIVGDPTSAFRDRSVGASGAIAGICGRIDTARGVWKAPAGTEATLSGITRLATKLTDAENGTLNPIGINALRTFDTYGHVNWGGRTTFGEDVRGSDWKYLPVRRLALFLEETLFRSTKWVIFEPNDEPLWAQIRLSVGAFMADLFHKGAFQGRTKREAYFVHCDATTTTALDQERGIVNLVVGFAPLKPAEFLIISIQQIPPHLEV